LEIVKIIYIKMSMGFLPCNAEYPCYVPVLGWKYIPEFNIFQYGWYYTDINSPQEPYGCLSAPYAYYDPDGCNDPFGPYGPGGTCDPCSVPFATWNYPKF
jgi:hypothetical protein